MNLNKCQPRSIQTDKIYARKENFESIFFHLFIKRDIYRQFAFTRTPREVVVFYNSIYIFFLHFNLNKYIYYLLYVRTSPFDKSE